MNRMGVGHWSDPSAQTLTQIDVPDAPDRPEVVVVTPSAIGIKWLAPTANVEGTSIGRFVIQISGGGASYEDKVPFFLTLRHCWLRGVLNHVNEMFAARARCNGSCRGLRALPSGVLTRRKKPRAQLTSGGCEWARRRTETSKCSWPNEQSVKSFKPSRYPAHGVCRSGCQRFLCIIALRCWQVARERAAKEARAKEEQRARWERGDFSDPKAEKRKRREEKEHRRREREERRAAAEDTLVPTDGRASKPLPRSTALAVAVSEAREKDGGDEGLPESSAAAAEAKKLGKNLVEHFFLFDGLEPGMMYRLRVAGISSIGLGRWSPTTFSIMTLATAPAKPPPPVILTKNVRMFGMRVDWTAPDECGSSIVAFRLRRCHDGSEILVSSNEVGR